MGGKKDPLLGMSKKKEADHKHRMDKQRQRRLEERASAIQISHDPKLLERQFKILVKLAPDMDIRKYGVEEQVGGE